MHGNRAIGRNGRHWRRAAGALGASAALLACAPAGLAQTERRGLVAGPPALRAPPDRNAPAPGAVHGVGTIVAGVECPRVRLDDGRVFSLQGGPVPPRRLVPGTRVRVAGEVAFLSICMQGAALRVVELEIADAP